MEDRSEKSFGAFLAFGIFLGLLVGLSEGPVVGGLIASVFSLVGVFVGILTSTKFKSAWFHDTIAAKWLLPTCLGAILGLTIGLMARLNDFLHFRSRSMLTELRELGFTEDQSTQIMARWAITLSPTTKLDEPLLGQRKDPWLLSGSDHSSPSIVASKIAMFVAKHRKFKDDELLPLVRAYFPEVASQTTNEGEDPTTTINNLLRQVQ